LNKKLIEKFLQEYSTTIGHLAHHTHVELPKLLISQRAAHAFADGIKERNIRRQLLLGGKNTFSEALNRALELEAADIAAGTPYRFQQTVVRTFWMSQSH
jgi:hypothetical protein